jgi:nucleoside-diphosphate-sugar epimerase
VAVGQSSLIGSVDICSGPPTRLGDLFAAVGEELGRPELVRIGARPYGANEVMEVPNDPEPLRATGWVPRFHLRSGIADTVAWWRAQARSS